MSRAVLACAVSVIVVSFALRSISTQIDILAVSFGSLVTLISVRFYEKLAELLIFKRGSLVQLFLFGTAKLIILLAFLYWIFNAERSTLLSSIGGLLIFIPAALFLKNPRS